MDYPCTLMQNFPGFLLYMPCSMIQCFHSHILCPLLGMVLTSPTLHHLCLAFPMGAWLTIPSPPSLSILCPCVVGTVTPTELRVYALLKNSKFSFSRLYTIEQLLNFVNHLLC